VKLAFVGQFSWRSHSHWLTESDSEWVTVTVSDSFIQWFTQVSQDSTQHSSAVASQWMIESIDSVNVQCQSLTDWLSQWVTDSDWVSEWMSDSFIDWVRGWLIDHWKKWLSDPIIQSVQCQWQWVISNELVSLLVGKSMIQSNQWVVSN